MGCPGEDSVEPRRLRDPGIGEAGMTTVAEPIVPAAPVNGRHPEQRFLLHDVGWHIYVAVGDLLGDRPALRLTYDRGTLEFMTTSPEHEIYQKRLGRLIETLAEEFNL